jgi:ABC-type amino acid transport system permease subunit
MFQTFSWHHVGFLAQAGLWTLLLSVIALAGGALLGALLMLARISIFPVLRGIAGAYIYVVQGIPLLVLLFIAYFRRWSQPASPSRSMPAPSSARSGAGPSNPSAAGNGRVRPRWA